MQSLQSDQFNLVIQPNSIFQSNVVRTMKIRVLNGNQKGVCSTTWLMTYANVFEHTDTAIMYGQPSSRHDVFSCVELFASILTLANIELDVNINAKAMLFLLCIRVTDIASVCKKRGLRRSISAGLKPYASSAMRSHLTGSIKAGLIRGLRAVRCSPMLQGALALLFQLG